MQRWRELKEAVEQLDDQEKRVRIEVPFCLFIQLCGLVPTAGWTPVYLARVANQRCGSVQRPHRQSSQHNVQA